MVRKILFSFILIFGFSTIAFSSHHEEDADFKKASDKKQTKSNRNQKAEADAALKKVEAMTRKARGGEDKKDKKPRKK